MNVEIRFPWIEVRMKGVFHIAGLLRSRFPAAVGNNMVRVEGVAHLFENLYHRFWDKLLRIGVGTLFKFVKGYKPPLRCGVDCHACPDR